MDQDSEGVVGSGLRYSTEELLHLRKSAPFVLLDLNKLKMDAEMWPVLNLPEQAKENSRFVIRTNELAKLNKRRPLVERASSNTTSTRRRTVSRSHGVSGFDDDEDRFLYRGHPSRKDIRETQWQLRRRGTSERSSQPIDAPPNILAQKDENFKKFFQAVISPTHVRVTAGGRIVPNPRGVPPPKPVFKWNPEQQHFDNAKKQSGSSDDHQAPSLQSGAVGTHGTAIQASGLSQGNETSENIPMLPSANETSGNTQLVPARRPIQISPPENFDFNRPFWIHPPGAEHPPQTQSSMMQMPGNAGMIYHPMHGYVQGPFQPNVGGNGMFFPNNAMAMPGMHSQPLPYANYPPMMFHGSQPLSNIANGSPAPVLPCGPFFPPTFAPQINPIEMKIKLAYCREDLDKLDAELRQNGPLMNKSAKLRQRECCAAEIKRLEVLIELDQNRRVAQASVLKSSSGDMMTHKKGRSPLVVDSSSATTRDALPNQSSFEKAKESPHEQPKSQPNSGLKPLQGKSRHRAKLEAAAATAVFEPRSQKLQSATDKEIELLAAKGNAAREARAMANKSDEGTLHSGMNNDMLMMGGPELPLNHVAYPQQRQNHAGGFPKIRPYIPPGAQFHASLRHMTSGPLDGVPYLKGLQPLGNGEYAYERQLTQEEVRARSLYWGKAPRELQRGLPKYNGKDFFPPSPVRPAMGSTTVTEVNRSHAPTGYTGSARLSDPFQETHLRHASDQKKGSEEGFSKSSWSDKAIRKKNSQDATGSAVAQMKATRRENQRELTDKTNNAQEEDQSTLASDRQSILSASEKRNQVENKPTFLQDMLKNPRYTSAFDRKDVSSDPSNGKPQFMQARTRVPTPSMAALSSGTITSTTAKGVLPQYQGSASASLAPNSESPDKYRSKLFARLSSTSDLLDQCSPPRSSSRARGTDGPAPSRRAAAEYLQSLAMKDQRENQKLGPALPGFPGRRGEAAQADDSS